jgi:hypothetical protein
MTGEETGMTGEETGMTAEETGITAVGLRNERPRVDGLVLSRVTPA